MPKLRPFAFFAAVLASLFLVRVFAEGQSGKAGPPPPYFIDESLLPFTSLAGAEGHWGVHKGAVYRIEVPAVWNGGLVLWNHGLRGDCVEPTDPPCNLAPSSPTLTQREIYISRGFAWAASSYSTAGRDISQAARDTMNLAGFFGAKFGQPSRTYVVGASLGGGVTTLMAEQWPHKFDAALPMCGVADYPQVLDVIALGYPVLAVTLAGQQANLTFPLPAGVDFVTDIYPPTRAALGLADPSPALPPLNNLTASGVTFRRAVEILSGGPRSVAAGNPRNLIDLAFWFWFRGNPGLFSFFRDVRHYDLAPGNISGNLDTIYQLDTDPALSAAEANLNALVPRDPYDHNSRIGNGLSGLPSTDGNLKIPMLSMHDIGDLFVPFVLQQDYARKVAANGKSHLLVNRGIREYQHCVFTPTELAEAFDALVGWVENGVKPAGDDLLNPATVSSPNFGCQFTRNPDSHGIANARPLSCTP